MSATRRARSPFAFVKGACQTLFATILVTILPDIIPETPLIYQPTLEELRLLNQYLITQKWNSFIQIIFNLWAAQSWNTTIFIGLPVLAFTLGLVYVTGIYLIKFIKFIYGQFEWCFIFTELSDSTLVSSIDYFTELRDYFEIINHSSLAVFNIIELISIFTVVFVIIKATIDFIIFVVLIDFEGLPLPLDTLHDQNYEVTKELAAEGLTIDLPSTIRNTPVVYEHANSSFNFISTSTPFKFNDISFTSNFKFDSTPINSNATISSTELENAEMFTELESSTHATLLAELARPTSTIITDQSHYQVTPASSSTLILSPVSRSRPVALTRPPPTPMTPTPSSRKSKPTKFTSSTRKSDPTPLTPPRTSNSSFASTVSTSTSTGLDLDHYFSSDEENEEVVGYSSNDSSFEDESESEFESEDEGEDEEIDDGIRFLYPSPIPQRFIPRKEKFEDIIENDFEQLPGAWVESYPFDNSMELNAKIKVPLTLEEIPAFYFQSQNPKSYRFGPLLNKEIKPLPTTTRWKQPKESKPTPKPTTPKPDYNYPLRVKKVKFVTPSTTPSNIRWKRKLGLVSTRSARTEFRNAGAASQFRSTRPRTEIPSYSPEISKSAWNDYSMLKDIEIIEYVTEAIIKSDDIKAVVVNQEVDQHINQMTAQIALGVIPRRGFGFSD